MTAHDESREPSREGPGAEYDGVDALMAALSDEPLPEPARRDPAFLAARDAAVADLAVLREQLSLIGDALAGAGGAVPAAREAAARPGRRPDTDAGPGRDTAPASPDSKGPGPENAPPALLTGLPSRSGDGPADAGGPRGARRPRRRTAKVVLGGLVAAAAAGLVLGTGWLVTQGGGTADSAARGVAADSKEAEAGSAAFGSPRYLACARLVAEGPVTAVEQVPGGAGVERVTVGASRYYKGEGEVTFLRDTAGEPPLEPGDLVLVGMPAGGERPDTVIAGEPGIAPERARIIAALPTSHALTCD